MLKWVFLLGTFQRILTYFIWESINVQVSCIVILPPAKYS